MTKKLFAALAMGTAVLMAGVMTAQAADVTFGGQIRARYESWIVPTVNVNNNFIEQRTRLNANAKIDDSLSAFIQLQSNLRYGIGADPSGNPPTSPNDQTTDVGLHQAYFVQKGLFGMPVDLKIGRQEIILDGHRIFGNTGWTQGAQSHDALGLWHRDGNHTLAFIFSKATEAAGRASAGGFGGGGSVPDDADADVYIFFANLKGLIGEKSSTSAYYVVVDQDKGAGTFTPASSAAPFGGFPVLAALPGGPASLAGATFHTFGLRQAGSISGIDYRVEGYVQAGSNGNPLVTGGTGERKGFMGGIRVGKKFGNVMWKPKLTLWADYLSGTDPGDRAAGDTGSFNTLFDTGHKFYGFMDFFLGEQGLGLVDLAIKTSIQPMAKTTIKLDLHHFETAEDLNSDRVATGALPAGTPESDETLGQEIDVTLVYAYSANLKMSAGYSHFFARTNATGPILGLGGITNEDAEWMYVMMDVKF